MTRYTFILTVRIDGLSERLPKIVVEQPRPDVTGALLSAVSLGQYAGHEVLGAELTGETTLSR